MPVKKFFLPLGFALVLSLSLGIFAASISYSLNHTVQGGPQNRTVLDAAKSPFKADFSTPMAANRTFFEAVANGNFAVAWEGLSRKSQRKFIQLVAKSEKIPISQARDLFQNNRPPIKMGFWKSFRTSSKLAMFVPQAKYQLIWEKGNRAEVRASSRGDRSLLGKLYKEKGKWRMGYMESFVQ